MNHVNFVQVVPDSQFYTALEQIIISLEAGSDVIDTDHIIVGLKNTIKNGYKLTAPPPPLKVGDVVVYKPKQSSPKIATIKALTPKTIRISVGRNLLIIKGSSTLIRV